MGIEKNEGEEKRKNEKTIMWTESCSFLMFSNKTTGCNDSCLTVPW